MNLCTDVIDAEPKTGQKNALCIITPEQEYYIRGDSKEIINGYVAHSQTHFHNIYFLLIILISRSEEREGSLKVNWCFY